MIRRILLAVAVLSATLPLQAQLREDAYAGLGDSETVAAFKQHVGMIASAMMEGRKAGSDGERMTAEYLTETLKDYGVDILSGPSGDVFGLRQENGDTLTSRNVLGFIQGTDKTLRDHYIVVGARMDNLGVGSMTVDGRRVDRIFYGANGNASGLAMLMELGRMLATGHLLLGRSVLLVGFGASVESFAGAWYFLNRSFSDAPLIDAMIDLDMLGTGTNGFYAYTSSNADMNLILENLSGRLLPVHRSYFRGQEEQRTADGDDIEYFPSMEEVLDNVLPNYLIGYIYSALVDSYCSEQNARMMAMERATDNAQDILDKLNLEYNHVRQSAITQEIIEVSAGAKSLKKNKAHRQEGNL